MTKLLIIYYLFWTKKTSFPMFDKTLFVNIVENMWDWDKHIWKIDQIFDDLSKVEVLDSH